MIPPSLPLALPSRCGSPCLFCLRFLNDLSEGGGGKLSRWQQQEQGGYECGVDAGTKPILFGSPREGLKLLDLLEDWRFDLFPLCLLFPCEKKDLLSFFFFFFVTDQPPGWPSPAPCSVGCEILGGLLACGLGGTAK